MPSRRDQCGSSFVAADAHRRRDQHGKGERLLLEQILDLILVDLHRARPHTFNDRFVEESPSYGDGSTMPEPGLGERDRRVENVARGDR